jgi:integrase
MAQYRHPDGSLKRELCATRSAANRLLRKRLGAKEHGLPVIAGVEKITFEQGAQAVIDDYKNTGKKSIDELERRIELHLRPFFSGRRLISILADDARRYTAKRKGDTYRGKAVPNAEINRELQVLKRILNLAVKDGRLPSRPHIAMLREDNVRQGFFEAHQYESVLKHLPDELQPVVTFAYITGWRIASEVLPMTWAQVDFASGEVATAVRHDEERRRPRHLHDVRASSSAPGSGDQARGAEKGGPPRAVVFWRMVAEGRRGPKKPRQIVSLTKAWKAACKAAGCPGRIPHDMRRTAVRNLSRVGVTTAVAMKITGHKTDSVFRRYDIVSEGDLREAALRLDAAPRVAAVK